MEMASQGHQPSIHRNWSRGKVRGEAGGEGSAGGEASPRLFKRMKVAIWGGKIQRGGLEGAGEGGAGEDGAGLPRRDAAEPAFPNAPQPGRAMGREGRTERQTSPDGRTSSGSTGMNESLPADSPLVVWSIPRMLPARGDAFTTPSLPPANPSRPQGPPLCPVPLGGAGRLNEKFTLLSPPLVKWLLNPAFPPLPKQGANRESLTGR